MLFAGRISNFNTLFLFYLSFFKTPKNVCKEIKKTQRNFLWGWRLNGRIFVSQKMKGG